MCLSITVALFHLGKYLFQITIRLSGIDLFCLILNKCQKVKEDKQRAVLVIQLTKTTQASCGLDSLFLPLVSFGSPIYTGCKGGSQASFLRIQKCRKGACYTSYTLVELPLE